MHTLQLVALFLVESAGVLRTSLVGTGRTRVFGSTVVYVISVRAYAIVGSATPTIIVLSRRASNIKQRSSNYCLILTNLTGIDLSFPVLSIDLLHNN